MTMHTIVKYIVPYELGEQWAHSDCKFRARIKGCDGEGEDLISWDYYHYYEINPQPWEWKKYNIELRDVPSGTSLVPLMNGKNYEEFVQAANNFNDDVIG